MQQIQLDLGGEPVQTGPAPYTRHLATEKWRRQLAEREAPPGASPNRVSEERLGEVARFVACGYKVHEIAEVLHVTTGWAGQLVAAAQEAGLVAKLSEGRDAAVKSMAAKRARIVDDALHIVQEDVRKGRKGIKESEAIDERVLSNAFKALERTEPKGQPLAVQVNVGLFDAAEIRKAQATSVRMGADG